MVFAGFFSAPYTEHEMLALSQRFTSSMFVLAAIFVEIDAISIKSPAGFDIRRFIWEMAPSPLCNVSASPWFLALG